MKKPFNYTFIKRKINNVKGWEVTFYEGTNNQGHILGFFRSLKEAKYYVQEHKLECVIKTLVEVEM